jgi:small nuclear ribonucleoprotein G
MAPELKKLLDKRISVKLNAKRVVSGRLRGFDHFLNLVLDDTVEEVSATEKKDVGLIVSH